MWTDYLKAFLVGGALCALGQVLIDRTKLTPARILTCYVVLGVVLHAVGVYAPLIEWAGAGASVPLTGFGSTLAKGVEKAVAEKGFLGAFTGGVSGVSPTSGSTKGFRNIYFGNGAPASSLGANGDVYINIG